MHYRWGYCQMKLLLKCALLGSATLALAGCATGPSGSSQGRISSAPSATAAVSDEIVKIGDTYKVGGKSYTPEDVTDYDETGYASWYGEELAGQPTANGEIFTPSRVSAAHKTLPLPSYVEVTALETGRTILVRVNDRGPFANDRLIDLSRGAAEQLGIVDQGVAGVRVRRVFPPQDERAQLRAGRPANLRPDTSEGLLTVLRQRLAALPKPVVPERRVTRAPAQAPAPRAPSAQTRSGRFVIENSDGTVTQRPVVQRPGNSTGNNRVDIANTVFVVQVAAFSSRSRADALAKEIGAKVFPSEDNSIWRVRYGPYANASAAESDLQKVRQNGYPNARILRASR